MPATISQIAFDEFNNECTKYDVKSCSIDCNSLKIEMNDGKTLVYAIPLSKKIDNIVDYIISGVHGRVFDKNGNFIGYSPKANILEAIFIGIDLMLTQQ